MLGFVEAMRDGRDLWPHNEDVINDEPVERAVLAALSNGVPPEAAFGVPLLRSCDPNVLAVPLVEVVVFDKREFLREPCDRCGRAVLPEHRLWIPCGASVVEVGCCAACRTELEHDYPDLIWR